MTVEINKHDSESAANRTNAPATKENLVKVHKSERKVNKSKKPNLDEIVTEKTEEETETVVVLRRNSVVESTSKEKGFSIQRAWCCLRNRRTS